MLPPLFRSEWIQCREILTEEAILVESAAIEAYGCTEFTEDGTIAPAQAIAEYYNYEPYVYPPPSPPNPPYNYPPFTPHPPYSPYIAPPYNGPPAVAVAPIEGDLGGERYVPDLLEVCLYYAYYDPPSTGTCEKVQAKIKEARILNKEEKCPSADLVDKCINGAEEEYKEALKGCTNDDDIRGRKCLTPEKAEMVFARITADYYKVYKGVCAEALAKI